MAIAFLGGHRDAGASNFGCEEHRLRAQQEDSLGPIPDDRQSYKPKMRAHIWSYKNRHSYKNIRCLREIKKPKKS